MLEKDEIQNLEKKLVLLQKDYVSTCKEFSKFKAGVDEKQLELSHASRELKAALKASRIQDRAIRNTKNEIAVYKKKISEMSGELEFIVREQERTEDESKKLSMEDRELMEKLAVITSRLKKSMDILGEDEKEWQEISSTVEAKKSEKSDLSAEISSLLMNISDETEKDAKALDLFSMNFGSLALDRESYKGKFEEREKVLSDLRGEITALNGNCVSIEETIELERTKASLTVDIKRLEGECKISGDESDGLEKSLSRKEADLKLVLTAKIEKGALVETFVGEIGAFDELATKAKDNENELGEADSSIEGAISDLGKLFAEGIAYERGFGLKLGLHS